MEIQRLLIIVTLIGVLSVGVESDYAPAPNYERCKKLEAKCSLHVFNVQQLLEHGTFGCLVTNGSLNVDCSKEAKKAVKKCYRKTGNACRSDTAVDLTLKKTVYEFICRHKEAFINAGPCTRSVDLPAIRQQCDVGQGHYQNVEDCRSAPTCVENAILASAGGRCTPGDATLFKQMVEAEYTLAMNDCFAWVE